jgi:hypothetical protein
MGWRRRCGLRRVRGLILQSLAIVRLRVMVAFAELRNFSLMFVIVERKPKQKELMLATML